MLTSSRAPAAARPASITSHGEVTKLAAESAAEICRNLLPLTKSRLAVKLDDESDSIK